MDVSLSRGDLIGSVDGDGRVEEGSRSSLGEGSDVSRGQREGGSRAEREIQTLSKQADEGTDEGGCG